MNYKEAYSLLYWFEDNKELAKEHFEIYGALKNFCQDNEISENEERILLRMMNIELSKFDAM
ncbi:MAG: hypothetical protein JNG85_06355 [Spirochaetaceae bacterium]|nr:hypothetical protein [Spirochaetaceae bacterium]